MVIADVSGKGIPAALFMMVSKLLIKNQSSLTRSPAEILRNVNDMLCENNQAEMFVTVCLGVLNTKTGVLISSNAGHEYPALRKKDGSFQLIRDRHGFVLGGMEGSRYREHTLQMEPGDCIFVYTDGVPEANNHSEELFGTQRMLDALNEDPNAGCEQLLKTVNSRIEAFSLGADQFDDITMLSMMYKGNRDGAAD